jgi:hypothetical protein
VKHVNATTFLQEIEMNTARMFLTALVLLCTSSMAMAADWVVGSSDDGVANTTTKTDIDGYFYRIRLDGRILRKQSGTSNYVNVALDALPKAARKEVAKKYDAFVPPVERRYDLATTSSYYTATTTTDKSDRRVTNTTTTTDKSDRRVKTTNTTDNSDRRVITNYRDQDVTYDAHTKGNHSPVVIAHDNHNSTIQVNVNPVDSTVTLAALGENSKLVQQLIAAERARSQADLALAREQCKPPCVQVVQVPCKPCCNPCPKVTLCARCWQCGSHFTDQFGRRWNRTSGPAMKHLPAQVSGCYGHNPSNGRLTLTVTWECGVTVFEDP